MGAIFLGALSLYYHDDAILNERIPILWSLGYFLVDILDCSLRGDVAYLCHAIFCFTLGLANYHTPLLRTLRMNSKATFCELSNPCLHLAQRTRRAAHFGLFAMVFTACRVVWLPVLLAQLQRAGMPWWDGRWLCLLAFYSLNWFWYAKILRILLGIGPQKKKNVEYDDNQVKKQA